MTPHDAKWVLYPHYGYGVIYYSDGSEVLMQGDEAWDFDDKLELLSEQQQQEVFDEYRDVAQQTEE